MLPNMGTRIAYTLTHVGADGFRVCTLPNWARCNWPTVEEAAQQRRVMLENNRPAVLADLYGPHMVDTLRVDAVAVYETGDRKLGHSVGQYCPAMDTTRTPEERETLAGVLASVGVQVIR